jgi:hypothetical protein
MKLVARAVVETLERVEAEQLEAAFESRRAAPRLVHAVLVAALSGEDERRGHRAISPHDRRSVSQVRHRGRFVSNR